MAKKVTDLIFKMEHQFTLYLQRMGLSRESVPAEQLIEIKMAFYGGASQLFFLMTQDCPKLTENEHVIVLEKIMDQFADFWNEQQTNKLNKRVDYAHQMRVRCVCGWSGVVADLIKPEKGNIDDTCRCPKCKSNELLIK